jgi:[ribosomal protein S18]-alanine N-acetyltransferase
LKANATCVRLATAADVGRLLDLERSATTAAHWSTEQYGKIFSESSPLRIILVIESEGGIHGFLVARGAGTEWEIENLAVEEAKRQAGSGRRLVEELLKIARAQSATSVFLEVRQSNSAARSLYEGCAFVACGSRKAYYSNPVEDAVVYRMELT